MEGCGIRDELMASIFCIIPVQPSNSFVGSNPSRACNDVIGVFEVAKTLADTVETVEEYTRSSFRQPVTPRST